MNENRPGLSDLNEPTKDSDACYWQGSLLERKLLRMSINWERLKALLDAADTINLTSHIRPDCDALGSELGMAGLLTQLGKTVRIVNGQATPPNLAFIDPQKQILEFDVDIKAEALLEADLWMILDTSAWAQIGPVSDTFRKFTGTKVVFDHHVGEDELDAELFKNTAAEATGRMVVDAARELGCQVTREMAMPLFAALTTDTGWMRFPSVTSTTYRTAAELVDAGASPADVYSSLYEQETLGRLRLKGVVLERIRTELEGRLAHTWIVSDDYANTGAVPSDTEDLVNHCLEIKGTEFAVILVGQKSGGYKISFRSRCDVACNELAAQFGGGGHRAAAGAFIEGELDSVREQILEPVRAALRQG